MGKINIEVGESFSFTKTIAECDVYLFAGITGDSSPNHINEEFCKTTPFKTRIAQGCLTFGLTSTTAAQAAKRTGQTCLSLGYDHLRFLKPVAIGDTIKSVYTVDSVDEERMRFTAKCELFNQRGELVLVCTHCCNCNRSGCIGNSVLQRSSHSGRIPYLRRGNFDRQWLSSSGGTDRSLYR